ncbi:MAG: hypothetical protein OEZ06_30195 [Myxococcales bacterium]|nr:hypothetical protein [Myxococcales bacterium]
MLAFPTVMRASMPEPDATTLATWASELGLPAAVVADIARVLAPLADWIATQQRTLGRALLLGISGAQGTGKSTLLWLLSRFLPQRHGLAVAGLSLDDLYLTAAERAIEASRVHPLLATRGVPGTHDLTLGHRLLDALLNPQAGRVELPRFDKALDDRAVRERWPVVTRPLDVVILEGWCLGARAQDSAELNSPQNELERVRDPDGRWRRHVNAQLAGPYAAFFERLDRLVMLRAPNMDCVRRWRLRQERALGRELLQKGGAGTPMDPAGVERFMQHFERLTRVTLAELPARADAIIDIDPQHRLGSLQLRQAHAGRDHQGAVAR